MPYATAQCLYCPDTNAIIDLLQPCGLTLYDGGTVAQVQATHGQQLEVLDLPTAYQRRDAGHPRHLAHLNVAC